MTATAARHPSADRARWRRAGPAPARRWCWPAPALALVAALLAGVWVGALPLPPGAVVVTLLDRARPRRRPVRRADRPRRRRSCSQLRLPRVLLAVLVGAGLAISGARLPGRLPQPAGRPVPARRRRRCRAGRHAGHRLLAVAVARAGRRRAARRLRRRAGRRRLRAGRSAPRRAARTAPPCCWPGSRSPPSSPPRRPSCSSRTPTTCARSTAGCSASSGRAQWSDVGLVLPYLGTAVRRAAALRPGARRARRRRRRGAARSACTPAGCGCWSSSPRRWPPPRPSRSAG